MKSTVVIGTTPIPMRREDARCATPHTDRQPDMCLAGC